LLKPQVPKQFRNLVSGRASCIQRSILERRVVPFHTRNEICVSLVLPPKPSWTPNRTHELVQKLPEIYGIDGRQALESGRTRRVNVRVEPGFVCGGHGLVHVLKLSPEDLEPVIVHQEQVQGRVEPTRPTCLSKTQVVHSYYIVTFLVTSAPVHRAIVRVLTRVVPQVVQLLRLGLVTSLPCFPRVLV
jgi:hypothetical protein